MANLKIPPADVAAFLDHVDTLKLCIAANQEQGRALPGQADAIRALVEIVERADQKPELGKNRVMRNAESLWEVCSRTGRTLGVAYITAFLEKLEEHLVPIRRDGNFVFIDGPGDVELDHGGRMRAALEKIASRTQTEGLLWWQIEARKGLGEEA